MIDDIGSPGAYALSMRLIMLDTSDNVCIQFGAINTDGHNDADYGYYGGYDWYWFQSVSVPTIWNKITFQWNTSGATSTRQFRIGWNDVYWTDWKPVQDYNCTGIKKIQIDDATFVLSTAYTMWWDSFSMGSAYGICGTSLDCVFCYNQTDCENNGCFWIIGDWASYDFTSQCVPTQPYIEEIASNTFNATSFHNANCKYATATSLYTGLTGATGGLLGYVSSWLAHFENLFDLAQAREKGVQFGEAIPKARGYLEMFNGLFGYFPIGEVLLIYLVILIAIIIFRIVRHIKSLLPFQ
jgi:hypothetical protein